MAPMTLRRRVLVIHNPVAGFFSARRFDRVLRHLAAFGAEVTVWPTSCRGDAERLASRASAERYDVVAAAGGDGTINEVVNGLDDADLPLAVIPLGTANVLAAEIHMPRRSRSIARTILSGPLLPVSLGLANGRRFVMMAGVGFDAHLVAHIDPKAKRLLGRLVYLIELLVGLFRFPYRRYQVRIDGRRYEAASVVIANGHYYGGRFTCAPEADLRDASLDVCLFLRSGAWNVLRYGCALALGRLRRLDDFRVVRGQRITIEGVKGEPVQCDGDIAGSLPLSIRPEDRRLALVVAASAPEERRGTA